MQPSAHSITGFRMEARPSPDRSCWRRWAKAAGRRRLGAGSRFDGGGRRQPAAAPLHVYDLPPIAEPLRRLIEWTADYYLAPLAAVLRMALPSSSALDGARTITEYRPTGDEPERLTPQRAQALERIAGRQGLVRELALAADVSDGVIRGLVKTGAIEAVEVSIDDPYRAPIRIMRRHSSKRHRRARRANS
jgi:primosomal protein N'